MPIKTLGSLGKIRVGRFTGNTHISFFGLSFLYLKGEWANVVADLGFHRGERRVTVYLNLVSEDNEENVSINWPRRYKSFFHCQLR